ncbi:MAG: efflux RND transporter periplasmic adaptor subunit, partial [Saprospiraceae bacterium]
MHQPILRCLILLFAASRCGSSANKATAETTVDTGTPVTITTVETGPLRSVAELNATAAFLQKSVVKANTNGYLRSGEIRLGQLVRAGQLLYTLQSKEASALGDLVQTLDSTFHPKTLISIRANQTGYITQLDRQSGDYVQDGEQLAVISDARSFAFVLDLPFELRRYLPLNRTVDLVLPDSSRLRATVASAMPTVDPASQTQRFVLKVPNVRASANLPENLIARVLWVTSVQAKAVSLPKAAVLTNEMQSEWWVMQLLNDSTAVKVPIRKGIEAGDQVE